MNRPIIRKIVICMTAITVLVSLSACSLLKPLFPRKMESQTTIAAETSEERTTERVTEKETVKETASIEEVTVEETEAETETETETKTETEAEEAAYNIGYIVDGKYINTTLGIQFEMPDGWKLDDRDTWSFLQEAKDYLPEELMTGTASYTEFGAINGTTNIYIVSSQMTNREKFAVDFLGIESCAEETFDLIIEALGSIGIENVECWLDSEVDFPLDDPYACICTRGDLAGGQLCQKQIMTVHKGYTISITVTALTEEECLSTLGCFSKIA